MEMGWPEKFGNPQYVRLFGKEHALCPQDRIIAEICGTLVVYAEGSKNLKLVDVVCDGAASYQGRHKGVVRLLRRRQAMPWLMCIYCACHNMKRVLLHACAEGSLSKDIKTFEMTIKR